MSTEGKGDWETDKEKHGEGDEEGRVSASGLAVGQSPYKNIQDIQ